MQVFDKNLKYKFKNRKLLKITIIWHVILPKIIVIGVKKKSVKNAFFSLYPNSIHSKHFYQNPNLGCKIEKPQVDYERKHGKEKQ